MLPGASTVRRWLNSINFSTEFSSKYSGGYPIAPATPLILGGWGGLCT